MPKVTENIPVTSAESFKKTKTFVAQIDPTLTVRMRRHDIVSLVVNGVLPLTLLKAAEKFREIQRGIGDVLSGDAAPDVSDKLSEQLKFIKEAEDAGFLEFFRRYACATVVEPKLTLEDTGAVNELWVGELDLTQLITIHNIGQGTVDLPVMPRDAAEEFRRSEQTVHGDDVPAREDVRPEPQLVVIGDRDAIYA